jgi:hypothetical protein
MKCPKCGYNSFEYNDVCKKCSNDLTNFKDVFGLKAIVLPLDARTSMAQAGITETHEVDQAAATEEAATDMFSFDLPEEEASDAATGDTDNPFNFDEEPDKAQPMSSGDFSFDDEEKSPQAKADEAAFASLLESTAHEDDSATAAQAASSKPTGASSAPGEFDLDNFSWDDATEAPEGVEKKTDDDFNSLFGDMDNTAKK